MGASQQGPAVWKDGFPQLDLEEEGHQRRRFESGGGDKETGGVMALGE